MIAAADGALSTTLTSNRTGVRPPVRDGYVDVPGMRLHYIDYGGDGEAVVALHGLVQNAHAFDGIAPALVPHVRLVALDVRGRGASNWGPPDSYRWCYYLNDLRAFVRALGLTTFSLVGTSMGGALALLYTIAHPQRVTRLVLNDTGLNNDKAGAARVAGRIALAPSDFADLDEAIGWSLRTRKGFNRLPPHAQAAWVSHYLTPTPAGRLRFNCDPVLIRRAKFIPPQFGPHVRPWSHRKVVWDQVRRLATPILLVRGELSEVVPRESAELMAEMLQDTSWAEVPGCGHAPTLYEPEAQAALRKFFRVNGT